VTSGQGELVQGASWQVGTLARGEVTRVLHARGQVGKWAR